MMAGPAANNESTIYAFLNSKGLSASQSAGVLANLQAESGFNPGIEGVNDGGPGVSAIGIAQWEGGRRTALRTYAAAHGGKETDLNMQLGYLWTELTGPYAGFFARFRSTTDPGTAAAYWDVGPGGTNSGTGFENSSGSTTGTRVGYAQSIYASIQSGSLKPGAIGAINGDAGTIAGLAAGTDSAAAAAGGGTSGSSWTDVLPWNWASAGVGGIVNAVLAFAMKMGFVGAGLVFVVLGAYRASGPAREKATEKAGQVAGAAAAVA